MKLTKTLKPEVPCSSPAGDSWADTYAPYVREALGQLGNINHASLIAQEVETPEGPIYFVPVTILSTPTEKVVEENDVVVYGIKVPAANGEGTGAVWHFASLHGEVEDESVTKRCMDLIKAEAQTSGMTTFEIAEKILSRAGHAHADPHEYLEDKRDGGQEDLGLSEEVEDEAMVLAWQLIKLIEEN